VPTHLGTSKALAPLPLPLGWSRPPVVNFEREGICTNYPEISPKAHILEPMKKYCAIATLIFLVLSISPTKAQENIQIVNCSIYGNFTIEKNILTKNNNCAGQVNLPNDLSEISENAFNGNQNIDSVVFGSGQLNIRKYAFYGASGIKQLSIPANVSSIGWGAFNGLTNLKILEINAAKATISELNFNDLTNLTTLTLAEGISVIPGNSFTGAKSLETLSIPSSVRKILANSFSGATKLSSLEIRNGLIELGYGTFRNLNSISEVRIPKSVEIISEESFSSAKTAQAFIVDKNNAVYASDSQGGLYDKSFTNLLRAPLGKEKFEIPSSVKFITKGAFGIPDFPAKSLGSLAIPASVSVVDPELRSMVSSEAAKKIALEKLVLEQFNALSRTLNGYKTEISKMLEKYPGFFLVNTDLKISLQRALDYKISTEASQIEIESIQRLIDGNPGNALASDFLRAQAGITKYVALEMKKAKTAKKTTITCVKGKLSKKVSAVNPKCPTGYKKAA
jgi:hypothetical protein